MRVEFEVLLIIYYTYYAIKSKDSVNLKTFVLLKPTKVTICVHFTAIIFLNILDRQNQIMLLMIDNVGLLIWMGDVG
jgi:hypothetical protein